MQKRKKECAPARARTRDPLPEDWARERAKTRQKYRQTVEGRVAEVWIDNGHPVLFKKALNTITKDTSKDTDNDPTSEDERSLLKATAKGIPVRPKI